MDNTALVVFNNEEFGDVRTAGTPDNPKFCLADVCRSLEIGNPSDVKNRLDQGVVSIETLQTAGGMQTLTFINEDGLYDVILDSRKPAAKKFRKWITSEVLPSIRKTGGYNAQVSAQDKFLRFAEVVTHLDPSVHQTAINAFLSMAGVRHVSQESVRAETTPMDTITVGDLFQQYIVPVKEIRVIPVGNGVKGHSASALYHYILKNFHDFMVSFCNHQAGVGRNKALILRSGTEEIVQALIEYNTSSSNARS